MGRVLGIVLQRLGGERATTHMVTAGVSSGGEPEHPVDESVPGSNVTLVDPSNLPLPNLEHHLVALGRPPRTNELTKVLFGTDLFLDGAVIVLQEAVQTLNSSLTAARLKHTFFLRLCDRSRIALRFMGIDHPRLGMRRICRCLGKRRLRSIGGSKRR